MSMTLTVLAPGGRFTAEQAYATAAEDMKAAEEAVLYLNETLGPLDTMQAATVREIIMAMRYRSHVQSGRLGQTS